MQLDLRVLGPVEAAGDGRLLQLGPPRQRALLALLVLRANQVVSTDSLIDELWGDSPPASAPHALQVYVSSLRRVLEPDRAKGGAGQVLVTRPPGYALMVDRGCSDLDRFETKVAAARQAASDGRMDLASVALDEALDLWRGQALADVADEPFAITAGAGLEEARLAALEDRVDAHLALGHHVSLVGELEALTRSNPFRERLWGQLIVGLYRSGRQADALRAYQELRSMLRDELGLEPSPSLRNLEAAILQQAPELEWTTPRDEPEASIGPPIVADPGRVVSGPLSANCFDPGEVETRAVVTVVVAGIVDSTNLAGRLEHEDIKLVMEGALARMLGPVALFGGSVTSVAGDGIVALFGVPAAHEDDPERALRAALRIVEDVTAYGAEVGQAWGVDALSARIGVHTGAVMFGSARRDAGAGATAFDVTLNTAAGLEAAARPGRVLVGESTRRLAEPLCSWSEVRQVALEVSAEPVAAHEVKSLHSRSGKVRGIDGVVVDIVGRQQELAVGFDSVDGVASGRGGVLLIGGEAGVGKSRLLVELRRRFRSVAPSGLGATWLEGRCVSYGQSLHYWPLRELLREWLGASPNQPELRARITLRRKTDDLFGERAAELLPGLGVVLGLPLERDAADRVATLRPESLQRSVSDALWAMLAQLAETGPVVVAIDDVHWADVESTHLLERLLSLSEEAAVLFILAGRPDRDHPSWRLRELALRELAHRSHEINLGALAGGVDGEFLAALVGPDTLPDKLTKQVLAAAEGNPFYVEELVRCLIGAGALALEDGIWRFDHDAAVEIPETVEKVLLCRIDQLPAGARSVLCTASVLGRQFRADLLAAVVEDESDPVEAVAQLQRAELLEEARRWPHPEYRFKHVLIQEAAYRTLTSERRRELHGRVGHALETRFPDRTAESYGLLARHLTEAGELTRALAYRCLAAEEARRVHAVDVAMVHYAAGLDLAEALPATTAQGSIDELHLGRGEVWALLGDATHARPEFDAALAGARAREDRHMQCEALAGLGRLLEFDLGERTQGLHCLEDALVIARSLGDRAGQVTLLNRLAVDLANDLEFVQAAEHTEAAVVLADETGDERVMATALDCRKLVAAYLGDFAVLGATVATLDDILRRHNDLWLLSFALAESAIEPTARGRWNDALGLIEEALVMKRRIADRSGQPLLLAMRAWVHRSRGAYQDALDTAKDALAMAVEIDQPWWTAWAGANLGATLLELHCPEQAAEPLARALAAAERIGVRSQLLRSCAHLAWSSCLTGDAAQADSLVRRAETLLAGVRAPDGMAWLFGADAYFAVARLHLDRDEPAPALEVLTPLVAAADAAGWAEPSAVGGVLVGRSHLAGGSLGPAKDALTRALAVADAHSLPAPALEAHTVITRMHRAEGCERVVDAHTTVALEIISLLADSIRGPEMRKRYIQQATSEVAVHQVDGDGPV